MHEKVFLGLTIDQVLFYVCSVLIPLAISIGYMIYSKRTANFVPRPAKPAKRLLYEYDKNGSLIETPLGRQFRSILPLWGRPDEVIEKGRYVCCFWQIDDDTYNAGSGYYYSLWFDRDSNTCCRIFPDPIHKSSFPV
jgi:regulator of extracellular matrix RemA (YlzA/DUF370 family)